MTDWRDAQLGDLVDIVHGFAFKGEFFGAGGATRLVTPGNFYEAGGFRDRGSLQKSYDGPVPDGYVLEPGDVVVAMTEQAAGLLGSAGLVPAHGTWLHNQRIGRVVVRSPRTNKRFVYYLFNEPTVRAQISATATGSKVRHTAPERIRAVRIRCPSHETQDRIAAVLGAFDALIEINERRIELLEELSRSLYREWFVLFRFPGHSASTDESNGALPTGWSGRRLGDVASVNASISRARELPDPLRYLDISSVTPRRIGSFAVMSAETAPGRARRRVRDGDVIWATVRPNRRSHAVIHEPPDDLIVSTGFAVLSPESVPSSFLFECSSSPQFADYLVGRATGSAYPAVRPGDFEDAPIVVAPDDLLSQFDTIVDPMLRMVSALLDANRSLASTRDLLLPRLVTGRLDVSDVDLGELLSAEDA